MFQRPRKRANVCLIKAVAGFIKIALEPTREREREREREKALVINIHIFLSLSQKKVNVTFWEGTNEQQQRRWYSVPKHQSLHLLDEG